MDLLDDDFVLRRKRHKKPCQFFTKLTSGLLCCLAFLPTEASAETLFLPDSGGDIFQQGLSVDVDSDAWGSGSYEDWMLSYIRTSTKAVSGEPGNVFVTEFGWNYDDLDPTVDGYCLIDSSTFDWESQSYTGPMADYAEVSAASSTLGTLSGPQSINFYDTSDDQLGIHDACFPPVDKEPVETIDISSGTLDLTWNHHYYNTDYMWLNGVQGAFSNYYYSAWKV